MKKIILVLVLIFTVFYLFGCSKEESNPVTGTNGPSLAGTWQGTAIPTGTIDECRIDANLSQNGSSVSGDGVITMVAFGVGVPFNCSIEGSNSYPNITLKFQPSGQIEPMIFTGSFANDDSLSGKLNGSGATNWEMTFVR